MSQTISCIICGKLETVYSDNEKCCKSCIANEVEPMRKKVTEFLQNNPGANWQTIIDSGIITLPESRKIKMSYIEYCNEVRNGIHFIIDQNIIDHKPYMNAMERDYDQLKKDDRSKLVEDLSEIRRKR